MSAPETAIAILETVLYAADLDAAERFYTDVLGLTLYAKADGRHLFFKLGGQMLLVFNPAATIVAQPATAPLPIPTHGMTGHGHVCFSASAAEIEAWRQRLEARGVAIEADFAWPAPDGQSGGRSIYFRDPAGNVLEFAEPRIWGL